MSLLRLAAVSAIVMVMVACNSYSPSSPSPQPDPTGGGPSTPVTIPRGASILGDRAFNPDVIEVDAGTTLTWTNTDTEAHTSTSNAAGWNSGTIPPNGRFSVVLQTPGTYPYRCTIHPGMVGSVVVR
jgi:plastocyanin